MHLLLQGWSIVINYYQAVLKAPFLSLQLIQRTAVRVLIGSRNGDPIPPIVDFVQLAHS